MDKYKHLYDAAVRVGEAHSRRVIAQANELMRLRRTIWKAVSQLRSGHPDQARQTLEQQIKKDQQP